MKGLVWFKDNLRLHDNFVLEKALNECEIVIPFYCFDKRKFELTNKGFPKTDYFRAKFLIESVSDLRNNLRKRGSDLVIRTGFTEKEIHKIVQKIGEIKIYSHSETTAEEVGVENSVKSILPNCVYSTYFDRTLYDPNKLPFDISKLPDVFTQFRKQVEKYSLINDLLNAPDKINPIHSQIEVGDIPTLEELNVAEKPADSRMVLNFEGGESNAISRLNEYLWESNSISNYKQTRNGLIGKNYSSKFSPWLANGSISPRKIYREVKKYEKQIVKNQSTYWLVFELIWRDYFKFVSMKFGNNIFKSGGIKGSNKKWKFDKRKFEAWSSGYTGIPFIDANMRELNATGFMSNRGRQNVASFLVKDLQIDWRYGAEYFESKLIDYDPESNYGNWNYVAGIGNDPRENRYFNILTQAKRYDEFGDYVKLWIPELANLSKEKIHIPFFLNKKELLKLNYPEAIVISEAWRKNI